MTSIAPKKENICAIIVTFDPNYDIIKETETLATQVKAAVIVDNGSQSKLAFVQSAARVADNITLIVNQENLGQGKALNQGVTWALGHGYQWVLLMDHDSLPEKDMVAEQIAAYHEALTQGIHAALIGVNATSKKTQKRLFKQCKEGKFFIPKGGIQTSGSLLSLQIYQQAGVFREDFFIDYIDTEYCLRLKVKKLHLIIACQADMLHELGKEGKSKYTANYPPWRRYYRTRNEIVLLKTYWRSQSLWVLKHIVYMLYEWTLILATEDNRLQKLKAAARGVRDAVRGRSGKAIFNF